MSIYRLSRQADQDLDGIADVIAEHNPSAAVRMLDALYDTFRSLAGSPGIGQRRDDLRANLHVFPGRRPAHNYVIFYYPIPDGIEVAAIIHGRRDWVAMWMHGQP